MLASPSTTTSPVRQHINPLSNGSTTNTESAITRAPQDNPELSTSPHETALLNNYLAAVQSKVLGNNPTLIEVPPKSNLGQWLEVYRTQLQHPVVQGWMHDQKIDQTTILTVNPRTGTLTAAADGKVKTFSLTDNSGWGQISRPLLEAANVIAPGTVERLQVRFGDDSIQVRAGLVANFQGERLPTSLAEARTQIRRLEHNHAFDPIPPDDLVRPANQRSTQALEKLKLSVETFYTQAPQALAYKHLAVEVAETLPNVRAQAKQWAESVIFKLTGKHVDADTLYLNRFNGSQSAPTATGWEHMDEEPTVSLRLPDALLKNFSENDWVPGNLDSEAGLYIDGPGKSKTVGYGAHNQFPLAPSALMHTSWKTDFQSVMTQKIDDFWNTHSKDYQTAIKGEFAYQARKQLKTAAARPPAEQALQAPEHRFTREDYRLVMGAVSNLPLDENAPLNVEQLKAEAPEKGAVQAHAFNIRGFVSNDILRFTDANDGRQVLYIPGAEPAFLRFDSMEKLDEWVIDQTKASKKRAALAAHFPLLTRQDHEASTLVHTAKVFMPILWFTNVGDKTDGLDTTLEKLANGTLDKPTYQGERASIKGDVFAAMTSSSKARMTSDADVMIKSNSEVTRDTWLNDITVAAGLLAKLAPIALPVAAAAGVTGLAELALGEEKSSSGDTLAEREDGASKAFDGLLNVLFSVGGLKGSARPLGIPEGELPKPLETPATSEGAEVVPSLQEEPVPGTSSGVRVPKSAPQPPSTSLVKMSEHAVPNGEQFIGGVTPNAEGVYQVKDSEGAYWQFIRCIDETATSRVFEIAPDYKIGGKVTQIINPKTGKPALRVGLGADGEWVRATADGGIRLPWRSTPSQIPSSETKGLSKFSERFLRADGSKNESAEKFDDYLNFKENTDYLFNNSLYQDGTTIKRRLTTSWQIDDRAFTVSPGEKAQPISVSDSEYSSSFAPDLNRERYSVITKQPTGEVRTNIDYQGETFEDTIERRIATLEKTVPNPELRARISEVAHQGSSFPALIELMPPTLKEGFSVSAREKNFIINYDPAGQVHTVKAMTQWQLRQIADDAMINVKDLDIVSTRTFTIRESNELDSGGFSIDRSAPTKIEVSTPSVV